ncbi:MAG TPA: N-acetyltransferase [Burkholderiales bacterium]|nr:N-acetyltransferase [Burkholderiales bacterium]
MLINKMYAWRGYDSGFKVGDRPDQMTLVASDYRVGTAIGTLTIGIDGSDGLLADAIYHSEADALRDNGARLCEMIKFAVERSVNSKRLLGALFHVAFIFAFYIHERTDILIEVTPQHSRFYRHLLGFEVLGDVRLNPRVNTEGVLMRLPLIFAADQISRFGGLGEASTERSLYPYAFSEREERGVIERLKRLEVLSGDPPSA